MSLRMGGISPAPCPWDPALPSGLGTASPFPGDKGTVLTASTLLFTPLVGRNGGQGVVGQTKNSLPAPPPRRWLKDGHPLGEQDGAVVSEDGGTLLITRVGLSHEGVYICQGSSRAGVAQAEVQVSVQGECSIWGKTCYPCRASGRTWLAKGVGVLGPAFWEV